MQDSPVREGVLAQLVERLNGIEEVRGSNPLGSTAEPRSLGDSTAVAERPSPSFPQPFRGARPAGNLRFDCLRFSAINNLVHLTRRAAKGGNPRG